MVLEARRPAPFWFWVFAILLTFWGAAGCYACYQQFTQGANALGPATDYDKALHASLPVWYNYCYALAVGTGLVGGIALLVRSGLAGIAFLVSLLAAIIQFGYLFSVTDIIAKKGADMVLPFPIVIVAIAFTAMLFAVHSYRKDWIN